MKDLGHMEKKKSGVNLQGHSLLRLLRNPGKQT